ncbi:MAG: 50S ribosomal protein L29 [Actinobacteria bacterium]|nr:MAG: 50S ribosomal protein L29 [Actinomycetota bacterium]
MTKEADQLRDVADDELETKLAEAKHELFNLRFQLVTGQLDNPMQIKVVRKQVARILTLMRERELEVHEGAGAAAVEEA